MGIQASEAAFPRRGKRQARSDVLSIEAGEVSQYLVFGRATRQVLEDVVHRNPRALDARLAALNSRGDDDVIVQLHTASSVLPASARCKSRRSGMVESQGRPAMSGLPYALCQGGRGQRDASQGRSWTALPPNCGASGDTCSRPPDYRDSGGSLARAVSRSSQPAQRLLLHYTHRSESDPLRIGRDVAGDWGCMFAGSAASESPKSRPRVRREITADRPEHQKPGAPRLQRASGRRAGQGSTEHHNGDDGTLQSHQGKSYGPCGQPVNCFIGSCAP